MNRSLNILIPLLLFLFITAMLPYLPGMDFDIRGGWQVWALYIHQNSLRNAYGSGTDYMPIYQYLLWLYVKMVGTDRAIIDNICYLRAFTLPFDFLGLWYVYKWIDRKVAFYIILIICMLNLGYSFDTIVWGQVDGILSAFVFITIYYAWKGNNVLSAIWLVLAFNFKVQAIVIIPVWGLLFVNNILDNKNWKNIAMPILAMVVAQALIVIPFTRGQYGVDKIVYVVIHSFNRFHSISVQASNIWHWLVSGNLLWADDTKVWIAGFTYKQIGLTLFFLTSFFALLPMMLLVFTRLKSGVKYSRLHRELIWATSAMVYLLFYFFNTEIHERYCQPAFIFITAYAFFSGDFITYILFSIMYFLTLEPTMHFLRLNNYDTLIFDLRFLSAINALIIILLAQKMHKYYIRSLAP